jgi:hypothetical protein
MPIDNQDPRYRLVREKYFSLRPKPLERYLWQQGLPQAAERVFWLHWEEGMRARDWCSQIPIRRVASLCCVDTSTVTRAYQLLKRLNLIRREDPGRDAENPFQQATAVTEVRLPRALLTELSQAPNRPAKAAPSEIAAIPPPTPVESPARDESPRLLAPSRHPSRQEIQALWGRVSGTEKARYFEASRAGLGRIAFDPDTALTAEDQAQLLAQLDQMARARTNPPPRPNSVQSQTVLPPRRRLSVLELARTRKRLQALVPQSASETLRQVSWAVEEGALSRFEIPLALNIALKKVREGAWTRPNRMPPQWLRAQPETCSAA